MEDIQNKRYEGIVSYFEEIYKTKGAWNKNSGIELMHDAYMNNYYITLFNSNEQFIWGMDPNDIKSNTHLNTMFTEPYGNFISQRFEINNNEAIVGYVDIGQYTPILLTEEDVNFQRSINESIILSGAMTLIIVIGISLYFSNQFSKPIIGVADISINLSKGNFDIKSVSVSNILELENLRNSVNILSEKLSYQDTLRRTLVSDISHEIRSPLNVLQNNLEAMIDGILPVTTERLSNLNEEVIRFSRLLNNLDILKEFESEAIKLNFKTLALDKLLDEVFKDFSIEAEHQKIKLNYAKEPEGDFYTIGDKDKIKQVFINLISNAIKFTPTGGNVNIKLFTDKYYIFVEIKDDGIGIKKDDLPFIFERLYKGDKSRHQIEGSGIGLTIVKNILQLHYANIEVESEEGKESTFKISFNKRGIGN
jgi:signal transduction histidine kinase